jgi:hypothetical protein
MTGLGEWQRIYVQHKKMSSMANSCTVGIPIHTLFSLDARFECRVSVQYLPSASTAWASHINQFRSSNGELGKETESIDFFLKRYRTPSDVLPLKSFSPPPNPHGTRIRRDTPARLIA